MMDRAITMDEYNSKVAYLNNNVYNGIKDAFINALGERIANKILAKYLEKSVRELSANSYVNIMDCFTIIQ